MIPQEPRAPPERRAGPYRVLAAVENDLLVRDPDPSMAGTDIPEVVVGSGETVAVGEAFKVTGALEVVSPGANEPEHVTGAPTFVWADDSSENHYTLVVFDALGTLVWDEPMVPGVSGADTVEVEYGGPALERGMYYQFRATAVKADPQGKPTPLSRTEDLRGVFIAG